MDVVGAKPSAHAVIVKATSAKKKKKNMAGLINFEDENEVKQFLDNLGVEYSFQCYKEKDPEGKMPALFTDQWC